MIALKLNFEVKQVKTRSAAVLLAVGVKYSPAPLPSRAHIAVRTIPPHKPHSTEPQAEHLHNKATFHTGCVLSRMQKKLKLSV